MIPADVQNTHYYDVVFIMPVEDDVTADGQAPELRRLLDDGADSWMFAEPIERFAQAAM